MMKRRSDSTVTPLQNVADTLTALIKVVLLSHPAGRIKAQKQEKPLIIMGNGPSLRETIDKHLDILCQNDTLAVNFAANSPEFFKIKPRYYTLADPLFFENSDAENMISLYENLNKVDWQMTLLVPVKAPVKISNPNINIKRFNMVGVDGARWLKHLLFSSRMAMPRPRNVLIPSIMAAIWLGYKNIYLVGADHSWMKSISVDEENHVVSIQTHFYKDSNKELGRKRDLFANVRLHEVAHSYYTAFKAYHTILDYITPKGIKIYNSTPESFIDAFERRNLSTLRTNNND
ncbi:MAG: hypothetical protein K2H44_01275 [Muribaculaceae bacterium]|nr:hypothetical protein [Muribaculaceae bacterium]MDE5844004.1 hypothetical protein [Muribaculaceae bacterium]